MAVSLSPVASAHHLSNISPSSTSTDFAFSPIYCAPVSIKRSKSTRNTVHWDKNIVYPSLDENTAPDARDDNNEQSDDNDNNNSHPSTANGSDSLGAQKPSAEFQFDFGDKKYRGYQRRTPLEPETFIAPDAPTESGDSTPTNNG